MPANCFRTLYDGVLKKPDVVLKAKCSHIGLVYYFLFLFIVIFDVFHFINFEGIFLLLMYSRIIPLIRH